MSLPREDLLKVDKDYDADDELIKNADGGIMTPLYR
jgi:hypothetical protein